MSHLLKALKSLESRGALVPPVEPSPAPSQIELMVQEDFGNVPILNAEESFQSATTVETAPPPATPPVRIKPRPAQRVKPRRAGVPAVAKLATARPLMSTLSQAVIPLEKPAESPPPTAAAAAQATQYTLAPAVAVNKEVLDAGAALARELALQSEEWKNLAEADGAETRQIHTPPAIHTPPRSATLFESRIRETLLHPARSRPFAELVQRLRQDFRGSRDRSLLFTGIGPASRGDEMLAHVAALLAEEGERVLLVDADFERAGLSGSFGAGKQGGLHNALAAPRTWQDHLVATSFENLMLLPVGHSSPIAATSGESLAGFIPKLEAEYPLVLIDGGQSSSSLLLPLARACAATYFVIRLGATDAKEAQGALKTFRAAGARVMGCVAVMANGE
jgi:Mrp family chromosome partitioning ATPase